MELSSSRLLVTERRTFCPFFPDERGGTVPLTPMAGVDLPSTGSLKLSIVSAMSVPLTVGRGFTIPPDTG
jgi:hypothetical protein